MTVVEKTCSMKWLEKNGYSKQDLFCNVVHLHKTSFKNLPISTIYFALKYTPVNYSDYKKQHEKEINHSRMIFEKYGYFSEDKNFEKAKKAIFEARYHNAYPLLYTINYELNK